MTVFAHLVAWGYANVLGNLVASAITTTLAVAWHHRRIKAHHASELRKLRIQLLGAIGEQRQDGDG